METKKNRAISAENLRMPLAFAGFLFTGGLLLASFSYTTPVEEQLLESHGFSSNEIVYVQEQKVDVPDETPQTAYVAPPQQRMVIEPPSITPPISVVTPPTPPVITITPTRPIVIPEPVDYPDVEAEFPGGAAEMQLWIASNVEYPETSIDIEEQGRVYLSFVVEADGKITNVEVVKSVSKDLDREAKRVIRNMPNWTPGELDGRRVRTRCRLPIIFTLQ